MHIFVLLTFKKKKKSIFFLSISLFFKSIERRQRIGVDNKNAFAIDRSYLHHDLSTGRFQRSWGITI